MRAFVALPIPPEAQRAIHSYQTRLRSLLPDRSVRWSKPEQWHITLHFLGNCPPAVMDEVSCHLDSVCSDYGGVNPRTHRLGVFPAVLRPNVLWIGIENSQGLKELQSAITRRIAKFGSSRESRDYCPHVTLARIRAPDVKTQETIGQLVVDNPPRPRWHGTPTTFSYSKVNRAIKVAAT